VRALVLRTLAVADMTMVTGAGPQLNVIRPPAATAPTTASDVQLAPEPVPTTRVGCDVSTARASAGTPARPFGLPTAGAGGGALVVAGGLAGVETTAAGVGLSPDVAGTGELVDGPADDLPGDPQPATVTSAAMASGVTSGVTSGINRELTRTHEW
jgi:hypothetical protein